ncbi:hypothetical protein OH76DRAFT_1401060 [Lentinus brumalis]|uniref:Uncharacterized protein n=1 Tax=Lentinus brumalis TaxID=2498619 RepID=A0A371DGI2_9APHY|nr:hypothetical protein OH76DRAFT_1401060 [Polyporus brumalis]
MPGTHGLVVPWDPPQFGLSNEVLEALVQKLMDEVLRHAEDAGETLADESRQSGLSDEDAPFYRFQRRKDTIIRPKS